MANIVSVEKVSKSFGIRDLFQDISFGIDSTDKLGIVGINGAGKSTLLKILAGMESSDSGRIAIRNGIKTEVLSQQDDFGEHDTVISYLTAKAPDQMDHWQRDKNIAEIFAGLKITENILASRLANLSGGQKRRISLAGVLLAQPDLLILDEPTNHLDVSTINWLGNYLKNSPVALICVTHDRWFLDAVCNKMLEIAEKKIIPFQGGFTAWLEARAERYRVAEVQMATKKNLAKREQEWLNTGAKARTSKAKYRIDAAEQLIAETNQKSDLNPELVNFSSRRQGKTVIELEDISYSYPEGTPIFSGITWKLSPQHRVGIMGDNGTGKSTLIKLLTGELPPTIGTRKEGVTTKIAVLTQEIEKLDPDKTIIEAISEVAEVITLGKEEISAAQLARKIGFSNVEQLMKVAKLSGGQRRRLQLIRLLMDKPNLLILDEPTNDLDIDTIMQLEELLAEWSGTLIVVSHDRYFLQNITDEIFALFNDGKLTNLPQGVEQFFSVKKSLINKPKKNTVIDTSPENGLSAAEKHALTKEQRSLERKIEKLEEQAKKLQSIMAEKASNLTELQKINSDYQVNQTTIEELQNQWFEILAQLEN